MSVVRIASFNVENLFSRAMVLNFENHSVGDAKLKIIAELQKELERTTYNKPKIVSLYKQVKSYIKFNVLRSSVGHNIIVKSGNSYKVKPNGRKAWLGFIEFRRDVFSDQTSKNTAKVIRDVDADITGVIEVDNRLTLKSFNSDRLNRRYNYNMLIDGNDQRGIDVGVYSKLEVGGIWTHIFDGGYPPTFSRDCLEVQLITSKWDSIYVLVNHFKSKSGGGGDARRKNQAKAVAKILKDYYDLDKEYVVVLGDLNDTPGSDPLKPLTSISELHDVLELEFGNNKSERWTYHYKSNEQIDYILVSDALKKKFKQAGVWRKGMADVAKHSGGTIQPYPSVTNWRDAASDHGAVWADFSL